MSIDPALHTAAIASLEQVLNRALALDPHGKKALQRLAGQVFALHCTRPEFQLYLKPGPEGEIRLAGYHEGPVTTRVRGEAGDFAELASARDPAAALINGGLSLEGNSAPLIELQKALAGIEPDWEAPLVDVLGDVAGHQAAEACRGLFGFAHRTRQSLERQLEEFIHEEARLSPPPLELEDFYRDVEALDQRTERLAGRLQRLRTRLERLRR